MKKLLLLLSLMPGILYAQKGYVNFTTFGFLKGTSSSVREAPLSFISEHHGMLSKRISVGLMTGIEQLNENVMPMAFSMRYYQPGKTRIFFDGYIGYSVSLEKPVNIYNEVPYKKASGGLITGLETGLMIPVNDFASVFLGVGYRYNTLHYMLDNDYWYDTIKRKLTYNRLSLRVGIVLL